MTGTSFEELFGAPRGARAARLDARELDAAAMDKAAVADPSKFSSIETELAEKLADMLGYDHSLTKHIRWLLERCNGDHEGLRAVLVAKAFDGDWLAWVWDNDIGIYAIRAVLVEAYRHREARETRRERENTTEHRRQKYIGTKYAEFIVS